nr:hypothetical protein CFP56_54546 [Quercus suber]
MIYESNWLPRESQGQVLSLPSPAFRNAIVSAFIDPQENGWNDRLVDSIFLPFEAQKIKAIPLCTTKQPDYMYWPKGSDGSYVVSLDLKIFPENRRGSRLLGFYAMLYEEKGTAYNQWRQGQFDAFGGLRRKLIILY